MKFKFNITIDDKDYLDYNTFWIFKSPYGKWQWIKFRLLLILPFAVLCLLPLTSENNSPQTIIVSIISATIMLILCQLLFKPIFIWIFKAHIRSLKKRGKMGYSPISEMEFYEDCFTEITPDNKTEQKYTAIERVSVLTDRVIYIHVNNLMAYIVPFNCFESEEQLNGFLAFLKTKCANIDIY